MRVAGGALGGQLGAQWDDARQESDENVRVEVALVRLVQQDDRVVLEQKVGGDRLEQHTVGHELDRGRLADGRIEPDLVGDLGHRQRQLGRDARRHRDRSDTARLRHANHARMVCTSGARVHPVRDRSKAGRGRGEGPGEGPDEGGARAGRGTGRRRGERGAWDRAKDPARVGRGGAWRAAKTWMARSTYPMACADGDELRRLAALVAVFLEAGQPCKRPPSSMGQVPNPWPVWHTSAAHTSSSASSKSLASSSFVERKKRAATLSLIGSLFLSSHPTVSYSTRPA